MKDRATNHSTRRNTCKHAHAHTWHDVLVSVLALVQLNLTCLLGHDPILNIDQIRYPQFLDAKHEVRD
jgi:hypothetical protein